MSGEVACEEPSQGSVEQAQVTEEEGDAAPQLPRSLPPLLPATSQPDERPLEHTSQPYQQPQEHQQQHHQTHPQQQQQYSQENWGGTSTSIREQQHHPSVDERGVFVIPNCPPTCVPDNPGSCPQILVLPFLPTAAQARNSRGTGARCGDISTHAIVTVAGGRNTCP